MYSPEYSRMPSPKKRGVMSKGKSEPSNIFSGWIAVNFRRVFIMSSWWWRWHTGEHPNFAVPNSIRTPPVHAKKKQASTFTIGSLSQGVGWSSTTVLSLRFSEGKFPARQMKEKVKHAKLFHLALKITIGWFLEDILNYQTQISTRRSAKTIVDSPATNVTQTRLFQPAKTYTPWD